MAYSTKWLRFRQAEEEYYTSRYDLLQDKAALVDNLHQAFARPQDRDTALRLLEQMTPDRAVLEPVLAQVVDTAIDSTDITAIQLARQILLLYHAEPWVRSTLPLIITPYLAAQDEWHYRRIAELYALVHYDEELACFLLLCQASTNAEIREISDDFAPS
ncbi:hypothetical protein [Hymenobacter volaticus]|uniref:HEAT repeat domain-containing protein n=1 Tax=Hymenobacter volaticus TaxID=2932254 RepID=A0ABY4GEB7_9BACT|nr:hypothetical protein [Hymenobacter volaticus]UOQ69188.1 hypothetical protein MUN86_26095 [Hymenobacter volaticus]